jgi:hypothetical protein
MRRGSLGNNEGGELEHRRLLIVPTTEGKRQRIVAVVVVGARRAARATGRDLAVPIARSNARRPAHQPARRALARSLGVRPLRVVRLRPQNRRTRRRAPAGDLAASPIASSCARHCERRGGGSGIPLRRARVFRGRGEDAVEGNPTPLRGWYK